MPLIRMADDDSAGTHGAQTRGPVAEKRQACELRPRIPQRRTTPWRHAAGGSHALSPRSLRPGAPARAPRAALRSSHPGRDARRGCDPLLPRSWRRPWRLARRRSRGGKPSRSRLHRRFHPQPRTAVAATPRLHAATPAFAARLRAGRSGQPRAPEAQRRREGRLHAPDGTPAWLAGARRRPRRPARLRRRRRSVEHAVADDGGGEGEGPDGTRRLQPVPLTCVRPPGAALSYRPTQ